MVDLWDILPECINKIKKNKAYNTYSSEHIDDFYETAMLKINWHDKTEIKRPMPEATEADVGKICYFWDDDVKYPKQIGLLSEIKTNNSIFKYVLGDSVCFAHCRRLTKQEIEKLI